MAILTKNQEYKKLGIQPKYGTLHREIESFEVLKRVQNALSRTTSSPLMNSFGSVGGVDGSLNCVLSPRVRLVLGFHFRINFEIWSSSLELIPSKLSTLFNSQDFLIQNFLRFLSQTNKDEWDGTATRKNGWSRIRFSKC